MTAILFDILLYLDNGKCQEKNQRKNKNIIQLPHMFNNGQYFRQNTEKSNCKKSHIKL